MVVVTASLHVPYRHYVGLHERQDGCALTPSSLVCFGKSVIATHPLELAYLFL